VIYLSGEIYGGRTWIVRRLAAGEGRIAWYLSGQRRDTMPLTVLIADDDRDIAW